MASPIVISTERSHDKTGKIAWHYLILTLVIHTRSL